MQDGSIQIVSAYRMPKKQVIKKAREWKKKLDGAPDASNNASVLQDSTYPEPLTIRDYLVAERSLRSNRPSGAAAPSKNTIAPDAAERNTDTQHRQAVESDDMNAAQRLVDEAARAFMNGPAAHQSDSRFSVVTALQPARS